MSILRRFLVLFSFLTGWAAAASERPNIVWISAEDISPHMGFLGDPHAITPHLDQLAAEGVIFSRTYMTAGVCAPSRSAIITGLYQTSIGTQHMRSSARLPSFIRLFPALLREQGYYTSNAAKEDYQLAANEPAKAEDWDDSSPAAHWRNRDDPDQSFLAVFNYGGTHESAIASEEKYAAVTSILSDDQRQDASALSTYPPYYPETPAAREDWKRNYELITAMDAWAGDIIAQLKADDLYEDTIIFFWSDHGIGLPRAKRWLYESGTHVPHVVRIPQKFRQPDQARPGTVDPQLISGIDFAPTVLHLAGIARPDHFQGRPFLGPDLPAPREYVYGARDRMDERYDIIRMVRDRRFRYIRNYEPHKTFYQYMNTPEKGATMRDLRQRHEAGTLNPIADRFFAPRKPREELYDVAADPHEIDNLATNSTYAPTLERLRQAHLEWVRRTRDTGLIPEPLLLRGEEAIGHRYGILRQADDPGFPDRLARMALRASQGASALTDLLAGLEDSQPAVRYWAATGLGNIGAPGAQSAHRELIIALRDSANVVRVAAARALCRLNDPARALPVLTEVLARGGQWERLHAAIVLDEIDAMAGPVRDEMRAALVPREELGQKGKYVVRVLNRALNQLEGTSHEVR